MPFAMSSRRLEREKSRVTYSLCRRAISFIAPAMRSQVRIASPEAAWFMAMRWRRLASASRRAFITAESESTSRKPCWRLRLFSSPRIRSRAWRACSGPRAS